MKEREEKDDCFAYSCLLKNELLGTSYENLRSVGDSVPLSPPSKKETQNLFQYQVGDRNTKTFDDTPYSLSPVGRNSQRLLYSAKRFVRKIPKSPFKILDAPNLPDDFYLNLVDWSSQNVVAVGLDTKVYLWNATTCEISHSSDVSTIPDDTVTSVSFNERGNILGIGTYLGHIHLWDVEYNRFLSTKRVHQSRIGVLAWNDERLASGSRDRSIMLWDYRCPSTTGSSFLVHHQEVCGLRWSPDRRLLASGSNDNRLILWGISSLQPVHIFTEHTAAVKALAWSPHQTNVLASGGGTGDKKIKFWNSLTCREVHSIDTGSQICSLMWSKDTNELVSTHGYQQNEIILWRYPSMSKIARLSGHSFRVLYLAMSPDGESIVTGAGDETLRFWKVFPKSHQEKQPTSPLNMFMKIR